MRSMRKAASDRTASEDFESFLVVARVGTRVGVPDSGPEDSAGRVRDLDRAIFAVSSRCRLSRAKPQRIA